VPSQSGLIGAFDSASFVSQQSVIAQDEVLVLYTDGVTEARAGGHMLDAAGLEAILARLSDVDVSQLPERIMQEVLDFTGGFLHDDIVIVCIKRSGGTDA
jgi:serine phosphatase RsbU (regulator of sigma subunit)